MKVNGKFVVPPSLPDVFEAHREDVGDQLRVCSPGHIVTYDPAKRTASIALAENIVLPNGKVVVVQAPLLDVPVFTLQGGGVHAGFPIQPDDECLVVFADFNIDAWHQNGGQQTPPDQSQHDINDGFALVGLNPLAKPLASALGPTEGGLATAAAKLAIDAATDLIAVENADQNLRLVLGNLAAALAALNAAVAAMTTGSIAAGTPQAAAVANAPAIAAVEAALPELLK